MTVGAGHRIEQLTAELRRVRAENASLRQREAALADELVETQKQQATTAEIVRMMRSVPADARAVFETVGKSAAGLSDTLFSGVHLFDGEMITLDAQHNIRPDELELLHQHVFPLRARRDSAVGRAVHDRAPVHIHDIRNDPDYRLPALQSSSGFRTVLAVPMLRAGKPIGAISVWRRDAMPYSDQQIQLIEALAEQAMLVRYYPRPDALRHQFDDLLADRLVRQLAVSQGDWEMVLQYLHAVELHARQEGLTWELARILEARASVVARFGRGVETTVRSLLEEALGLYERLDDRIEVARLREHVMMRSRRGGRDKLPAGLTRREAEVLRLVTAGLSNRDIAGALNLSEKTVEHHLTSAYGRIGADNRAAASAFAVRHGLA